MVSLRTILAVPILLGLTATALPNPASPLNNDLAVPHTSNLNAYDLREIHLDHAQGDGHSDGFAGGRTILRKPGYPDITLMGEGTSFTGFGQTIVHTGNKTRIYLWNPETLLFEEVKEQDQAPPSHLNVYQARITISGGGDSRYSHCPRDTSWDTDTPMQGETRITNTIKNISQVIIAKNGIEKIYVCNKETKAWEKYYEGPDGSGTHYDCPDRELISGGVSIGSNRRVTSVTNDKMTVYVCNNETRTWDKYEGPMNGTNGAGMRFPAGSSKAAAVTTPVTAGSAMAVIAVVLVAAMAL